MGETLLDYLRRKNPTIKDLIHPSNSNKTTKSGKSSKPSRSSTKRSTYTAPKWIARWEGFDIKTLQNMYSDVLGQVQTRDPIEIRATDLRVRNETGGLSDLVFIWNREVVFRALEETKEYMGRDDLVYMVRGALARDPHGPTKPFHPDWAATTLGLHSQTDESLTKNHLPGDTKHSNCWKSESVEEGECVDMVGPQGVYPDWFWPVAQVFTYCYRLETRYAYIITDEELVLFRVGPNKDSSRPSLKSRKLDLEEVESDGKIEFVSVPWKNGRNEEGAELGEPNGLSINTALWWIHLQAAHENSIQWVYPPLEDEVLQRQEAFRPGDDTELLRNDSCRLSAVYTPTERAASDASDIIPSFMHDQEAAQFNIPNSSAASIGPNTRRRNADRNQTTSSFGSTAPHASFASHSSVTSNKNRVEKSKAKTGKRGRLARSNSANKRGSRRKP